MPNLTINLKKDIVLSDYANKDFTINSSKRTASLGNDVIINGVYKGSTDSEGNAVIEIPQSPLNTYYIFIVDDLYINFNMPNANANLAERARAFDDGGVVTTKRLGTGLVVDDEGDINVTASASGTYTAGEGLSLTAGGEFSVDNPFTESDETKLDGIATGAEVNVQSDWNETTSTSDAFIKNKPTVGDQNVQSDWDETDTSADSYIQNKPTIPVNTDTTYTAGDGLSLSNSNEFSVADDSITEAMLDAHNSPSDGQFLEYDSTNGLQWATVSSGGGSYAAGDGISISGTTISVNDDSVDEAMLDISNSPSAGDFLQYKDSTDSLTWATPAGQTYTAGTNITISDANVISATDTDTTYTAGDGLDLTSGAFSVDLDGSTLTSSSTGLKVSTDGITGTQIADDAVGRAHLNSDVAGTGIDQNTDGSLEIALGNGVEVSSGDLTIKLPDNSGLKVNSTGLMVNNGSITEDMLDIHNSPSDGQVLAYDTTNGLQWEAKGSGGGSLDISSLTEVTSLATGDDFVVDDSGTEKKVSYANFIKSFGNLTAHNSPASADVAAVVDVSASVERKMTLGKMVQGGLSVGNGLTKTDAGNTTATSLAIDVASADDLDSGTANKMVDAAELSRWISNEWVAPTTFTGGKYEAHSTWSTAVAGDMSSVTLSSPTRYEFYIKPLSTWSLGGPLKPASRIRIQKDASNHIEGTIDKIIINYNSGVFDYYRVLLTGQPTTTGTVSDEDSVSLIIEGPASVAVNDLIDDLVIPTVATDSVFETGTSTTDTTTVKQVRDFGKAASSIATKWNGEVNPVTAGLATLSPYSSATGGAATYYSATNDRWELMRAGTAPGTGAKVGNLVFENAFFDYSQMAMAFQVSMDQQTAGDGNSWIDMYWGAAATDLDSSSDNWIGTATKGLYVRAKRRSTNNKLLMSFGINDSTIRTALGSKTGGWQNRYYLPNFSGNFDYTGYAKAASTSNTEEAIEVDIVLGDTDKVWISFNVFNEFLSVYVDGTLACTLDLGFVPGVGNTYTFGPKFGIMGDDGGGVPTAFFGYLHAMALGTPDPLNALSYLRSPAIIPNPDGTGTTTLTKLNVGDTIYNLVDNNTTYSAGNGLTLSSTTFSANLDGSTLASSSTGLKIADGGVTNTQIADDTISEAKLDIHDSPATGEVLGYTSNGMEWVSSGLSYDDRGNHTATFATAYVLIGLTNDWVEGDLSGDIKDGDLFTITISKYKGQNTSQGGAFSMSGKQLKNLEEAVVGDTINAANYDQRKIHTQRIEIMDEGGSLQSFDLFFARSSTNGALIAADDASRDCDVHISRWGGV